MDSQILNLNKYNYQFIDLKKSLKKSLYKN